MYTSDKMILQIYQSMIDSKAINFDSDFYSPIGMTRQVFANIKNQHKYEGRQSRHFTPEHIEKICKVFQIDANYIFGLSDTMHITAKN